ncbi:AraC family transcriptional regulator [Hespellia stercorisuis]|uniref:AraC-type DNA-binding protein n=1 Tax=Hespellia stercorisuis DSM 15480 TaxID=1121950 RepID=A0A1M6M6C3_9FIRM|nr:AraC family transcriptional regulator [Hespellia stercorisuis]SHJ79012.1 AraC-type DNA-binding protein [Hespellia stercorisuis DSM 15480]
MEYTHELIIPNDNLPFKLFLFEGKDGGYIREKHWHRSIEIFAVFEGTLTFMVNEKECPLQQGEFILVNTNEVHSILAPEPNRTLVLQIPLGAFENYYTDERFILFSHSPREQDERFMSVLGQLYKNYEEQKTGYDFKVQSLFFELMYLLVSKYRKTEVNPEAVRQNKRLNRLSQITEYLRSNYREELSLESLAEIFGYSPTYLSRMFQKYAKINYKTYLQNIRLEYGMRELMNTEHTISDIAADNGFASSKAFSGAFYRRYGVLPSEYRKNR